MGIIILLMYIYLLKHYSYDIALTLCFTFVVIAQWINGIQAQKQREPFLKNIRKSFSINPYIYIAIGLGVLLQFFAVYGANTVFQTVPIRLCNWSYILFIALATFFVVEARKWVETIIVKIYEKKKREKHL